MNELTQQENINSNVAVFSPQSTAAIQTFSGNGFRHGYCTGTPPGKSIRLHGHHHAGDAVANEPLRSSSENFRCEWCARI